MVSPNKTWRKALEYVREMHRVHERYGNERVRPDVVTYTTLIAAFSRSHSHSAIGWARKLFAEMKRRHREDGDVRLKPNVFTYSAMIAAMSKSRDDDAPLVAQGLLDEMHRLVQEEEDESLRPTTVTYNAVISTWARSSDPNAPFKAHAVLQEMKTLSLRNANKDATMAALVRPDVVSYNTVLAAWSRSTDKAAAVKHGMDLLEEMKQLTRNGNTAVQPDSVTYSTLVAICADQSGREASNYVTKLLAEMESLKDV